MSEIKYINLEDDRLWEILFDEACVEGGQAERIQKELEKIAIDEKEITRKPMQEQSQKFTNEFMFEEKLQEIVYWLEKKINPLHNVNWNSAIEEAIEIVKGVMNG